MSEFVISSEDTSPKNGQSARDGYGPNSLRIDLRSSKIVNLRDVTQYIGVGVSNPYTVFIIYDATMYREAGARHRVYFNPQHAYASSQKLGRGLGTMPNTGKCILGNHLSLVFHNGGNLGSMHSY